MIPTKPVAAVLVFLLAAAGLSANPFVTPDNDLGLEPVRVTEPIKALSESQGGLRDRLADEIEEWKTSGSFLSIFTVLGVAALYGFLHALGPGHRKTVVFSLFIAKKAAWWEPLVTGLTLSILHAGTSIILILFLDSAKGLISQKSETISVALEGGAYVLLALLSAAFLAKAVFDLARRRLDEPGSMGRAAIFVTGAYPCPGAILILAFATRLGVTGVGILAVLAMSIGMSAPIIASGYLAWFGRTGLFTRLKAGANTLRLLSGTVEIAGYLILLGFALYIGWPFFLSLFRLLVRAG